jgi:hypothetical protein
MFLCARCRAQVWLCTHCDRGQRYCSAACSRACRREAQRAAASRYQSGPGRAAHAERQRRWRARANAASQFEAEGRVTHQGSHDEGADAPLVACEPPIDAADRLLAAATPETAAATTTPSRCARCSCPVPAFVRNGFLRHASRRWPLHLFDPHPEED